ncbi:hypothetical protein [Mesorhizobium sp. 131-2-5]|uniref:hypothetical protein n=1 Tax=Mesorhizobium sp. 131-2-5 TaxID=2744519 RepID=UPI00192620AD|nr:hypothetical protein [Mesorhizobium sp. 131-2-5]
MSRIVILALAFALPTQQPDRDSNSSSNFQVATTCFKTGERDAGMNKICYYDCLGSEAAITIKSYELCPLSIDN